MSLNGYVDALRETDIAGWAADDADLARQVSVEILVNGVVVATLRCSMFREDLRKAGLGDGCKAFHFDPRGYLCAGVNAVEVRHAGTGARLVNGSGNLITVSGVDLRSMKHEELGRLLEASQERWKGSESDAGLTWGAVFTGDSFIEALQSRFSFGGSLRICEIGPGYGRLLKTILDRKLPFRSYTGVELSLERVHALQDKFKRPAVEFIQGDVNTVLLAEKADLLICSATFEHLFPDCSAALTNLAARNLRPGAWLAIDFIQSDDAMAHRSQEFEPTGHAFVRIYSAEELRRLHADCGLEVVALESIVLGRASYGDVRRILVFSRNGT